MDLSARLRLQLALVEVSEVRAARVHAVALLSLPVAVAAAWPELLSPLALRAALVPWGLAAASALAALVSELRLALRLGRARTGPALYDGAHVSRREQPPAA
jgi:hypothetical protein